MSPPCLRGALALAVMLAGGGGAVSLPVAAQEPGTAPSAEREPPPATDSPSHPKPGARQPTQRGASVRKRQDRRAAARRRERRSEARRRRDRAEEQAAKRRSARREAAKGRTNRRARARKRRQRARSALERRAAASPLAAPPPPRAIPPPPAPGGSSIIDRLRFPPFLLPLYQAAGNRYGVRWEVLAAINDVETAFGRDIGVSSAGARGWMQFMPATWRDYGLDANHDGRRDPGNPVDAIFAAARYLRAAGAGRDLPGALFAYNHADWYVRLVLARAEAIGGLPGDVVGSLTGLFEGRFPVHARARYADLSSQRAAYDRALERAGHRRAKPNPGAVDIYAQSGAPVIAASDGIVKKMGRSRRMGRFVVVTDAYGTSYTYSHLGSLATRHPLPKYLGRGEAAGAPVSRPSADPPPSMAATPGPDAAALAPGTPLGSLVRALGAWLWPAAADPPASAPGATVFTSEVSAPWPWPVPAPTRAAGATTGPVTSSSPAAGASAVPVAAGSRARASSSRGRGAWETFRPTTGEPLPLRPGEVDMRRLRPGSRVIAGAVLGRIGQFREGVAPHLRFEIDPAGRGDRPIDAKLVLDAWRQLEAAGAYRGAARTGFFGAGAGAPSAEQFLLMSEKALRRHVLTDRRIEIYACGRGDVRAGRIDKRVLATLEFLAASGLEPTVSSLRCGHSYLTSSGNVSEHTTGTAVDISKVNGVPIAGHQGRDSITELTIRRLLVMQGASKPHQVISLMPFEGEDNTLAMDDHDDHIHVGFRPRPGRDALGRRQLGRVLRPGVWSDLADRLGGIENPGVRRRPSRFALPRGSARPPGG